MFMPSVAAGHFRAANGTNSKTQLYSAATTELSGFIGELDVNNKPLYTSINDDVAYLKQLSKDIDQLDVVDYLSNYQKAHYVDITRYVIITTIILISKMKKIPCDISYIRINNDTNDSYAPYRKVDDGFPGESTFATVLNDIAEYVDPALFSYDTTKTKQYRMLCVVRVNGTPVALYSSTHNHKFFPYKTILSSNEADVETLPGISMNNEGEWEFDLAQFQVDIDKLLSKDEKSILGALLNDYINNLAGNIEGFRAITQALELSVNPAVVAPLYDTMPLTVGIYIPRSADKNAYRAIRASKDLPDYSDTYSWAKVPVSKQEAINLGYDSSIDPFFAFGYSIPKCECNSVDGVNGLLMLHTNDLGVEYYYNNQLITSKGIPVAINSLTAPLKLEAKLKAEDGVSITIKDIPVKLIPTNYKIRFIEPNNLLIYSDHDVKIIHPFVDIYWCDVSELLPITRECIQSLKSLSYHIGKFNPIQEVDANNKKVLSCRVEVTITDSNNTEVLTMTHMYSKEHLQTANDEIALRSVNQSLQPYMPQLSIYPFVQFLSGADSVWNKYFVTALCVCDPEQTLYRYFDRLKFSYDDRSGNVQMMTFKRKPILDAGGSGDLGFKAEISCIPEFFYITASMSSDYELGVIQLPTPNTIPVDKSKEAIAGIDMGSRNSIIAMKYGNAIDYHFDSGEYIFTFCNSLTPFNPDAWTDVQRIFGVTNCEVDKNFLSAVLDYTDVPEKERKVPYLHGRIAADISSESYKRILDLARQIPSVNVKVGQTRVDAIGLHSNFKKALWAYGAGDTASGPVILFVNNLLHKIVLNAFSQGYGKITIRFTAPNEKCGNKLHDLWDKTIQGFVSEYGVGTGAEISSAIFQNTAPDGTQKNMSYMLESEALYHNIRNATGKKGVHEFTIVVDGGDSTFDVSLFRKVAGGDFSLSRMFSISYGGYRLIIQSVREIMSAKKDGTKEYTSTDFLPVWGSQEATGEMDKTDKKIILPLIASMAARPDAETIKRDGNGEEELLSFDINWNSDSVNEAIYKLVEEVSFNKENPLAQKIIELIRVKYLLLMNAIIETCIGLLPSEETGDHTITLSLYGGANSVLKLLYDGVNFANEFGDTVKKWLNHYYNPRRIDNVQVQYKVVREKTELVTGLVESSGAAKQEILKDSFSKIEPFDPSHYQKTIEFVFDSSSRIKNALEYSDMQINADLASSDPKEIHTNIVTSVKGRESLDDPYCSGFPEEVFERLYTLFRALEVYPYNDVTDN